MKGSLDSTFKLELKTLILKEADKDISPESLADDAPLFGPQSSLQLDSIDGLQISMALQLRYEANGKTLLRFNMTREQWSAGEKKA